MAAAMAKAEITNEQISDKMLEAFNKFSKIYSIKHDLDNYNNYMNRVVENVICGTTHCKIYKLDNDGNSINFSNPIDLNIFSKEKNLLKDFTLPESVNINIMSFGKSLYYILRYIVFILHNHSSNLYDELKKNKINFIIYVDSDTFKIYNDNIPIINNYKDLPVNDTVKNYWKKKNFAAILHSIGEENFTNCTHEIDFLNNIKDICNLYFLESSHYLMKGIGGKRAVMNYVNYLIPEKFYGADGIREKSKYTCMYLDDNISMIVHLSNNDNKSDICDSSKRELDIDEDEAGAAAAAVVTDTGAAASAKKRHDDKEDKEDYTPMNGGACTKRTFGEIKIKNYTEDDEKYKSLRCECDNESKSIFDIYLMGVGKLSDNENTMMYSINKGSGLGDGVYVEDIKSSTAYKLSLQKSWMIYDKKIFYNPFFSRALEDIIFNIFVNKNEGGIRNAAYYIRFAHSYSDQQDAEDNFPDYINSAGVKGIHQITFMCLYYIFILNNMGHIQISPDIDKYTLFGQDFLNITGRSKYTKYHKDIFKMLLLIELQKKPSEIMDEITPFKKKLDTFKFNNLYIIFKDIKHEDFINMIYNIFNKKYKHKHIEDKERFITRIKLIIGNDKNYKDFINNPINNFGDNNHLNNYKEERQPIINKINTEKVDKITTKSFGNIKLTKIFKETVKFKMQDKNNRNYIKYKNLVKLGIMNDDNDEFIINININYFDKFINIDRDILDILNEIDPDTFGIKKEISVFDANNDINIDWFYDVLNKNNFDIFITYLEKICELIYNNYDNLFPQHMQIKYLKYKLKYLKLKKQIQLNK